MRLTVEEQIRQHAAAADEIQTFWRVQVGRAKTNKFISAEEECIEKNAQMIAFLSKLLAEYNDQDPKEVIWIPRFVYINHGMNDAMMRLVTQFDRSRQEKIMSRAIELGYTSTHLSEVK